MHNPTNAIVQAAFTQHDDSTRTVEKITNIATTTTIMQLAPIPAYLVYDSFEQELDAAKVHRLWSSEHESECKEHASSFL